MKKYLLILLVALVGVGFTSCKKKPAATLRVAVLDAFSETEPVTGCDVCVFSNYSWENEMHVMSNALYHLATDNAGVVTFTVDGFWLSEKGTIMYVSTMDGKGVPVAYKQVTLKPGETTEVVLLD